MLCDWDKKIDVYSNETVKHYHAQPAGYATYYRYDVQR